MTTPPGGTLAGHLQAMLQTHPRPQSPFDLQALVQCVNCAQTCTSCTDACLSESMVQELTHCIRLYLNCADVCNATGRVLARSTQPDRQVLQACLLARRGCGAECQQHAHHHQHCAVCADACRRCEGACNRLLGMAA